MTAGDRNSGWREMQSQLGERFDVSQGVRRLQQPCPLWRGLFCPFGGTPRRNPLPKKIMHLFWSSKAIKNLATRVFDGMFMEGGEDKYWMYTMKPVAVCVSACCLWDHVVGCLALSLPVSLLWVGVMRNLHMRTKCIIYYIRKLSHHFKLFFSRSFPVISSQHPR